MVSLLELLLKDKGKGAKGYQQLLSGSKIMIRKIKRRLGVME
jgi:hypothetical protein